MAAITIRRLSEETKQWLRVRAAHHGRSMEAEAREILETAARPRPDVSWLDILLEASDDVGGVTLDLPARETRPVDLFADL
jgi:antitoxin FitA